jgi:PKD repeat protein
MSYHAIRLPISKRVMRGTAGIAVWVALPLAFLSTALASPPELVFSTFLGGTDSEQLAAVARDAAGNVYVAGTAQQNYPPLAKMLVAKYSTEGTLLWSRTIDFADRLGVVPNAAVTADGRFCVVGSALLPSSGPPVSRFGPGGDLDGLVVLMTPDGAVQSTTYIGGSRSEEIDGVAIAPDGSIIVVGTTYSMDFPTSHPFQATLGGGRDAFVAVLSADASSLIASSYLGGSTDDPATGVAVDGQGAIWVVGSTASFDFPYQRSLIGTHECGTFGGAFVAKLAPGGQSVEFSARLCGSRGSQANAVAVDGMGNAFVVGSTQAPDFPTTTGALKTSISGSGTSDAFVTAVASVGDRLLFSTYLGGSGGTPGVGPGGFGRETANGVAVDASGRVFVVGATSSVDFPLVQPLQTQLGDSLVGDGFLSVLDATGSRLEFSTYLGERDIDSANGVAVPAFGRVVVAGTTRSADFPVAHAAQPTFGGGLSDGFVAEIALEPAPLSASAAASPAAGLAPLTVELQCLPSGGLPPYTFDWAFGDGSAHSTEQNPSHIYSVGGDDVATVSVTDSAGATASASVAISVTPNCWVACSASVPLATGVGQVTSFTSSATPTDCAGSVSYSWGFGDGQSSTQQGAVHSYSSAGLYPWSFTATAGAASCTRSGTIVVTAAAANFSYLIPALAHKPGFFGSQWRADIAVLNPNDATANLTLVYLSESAPVLRSALLAGHISVEWSDVLVALFGFPPGASTSGVVQVISDVPVASTGRSYNLSDGGTFGGTFPALTAADGLGSGKVGLLPGIKRTAAYRSNVGFANPGTFTSTVRLRLFNAGGVKLGEKTLDVAAGRWTQIDDVFGKLGAGDADLAYGTVEVLTQGGTVWAYAAVIDNATGDPTIVPVIVP